MACFTFYVVGGAGVETITGVLGHNVLLPCVCPNATLNDDFRWQKEDSKEKVYGSESNNVNDKYRNRSKIFLSGNNSNCSILLTNITADDQGKYRCSHQKDMYKKKFVYLNVSSKSVCHYSYHCI